jgi:hypothetical protein
MGILKTLLTGGCILGKICQTISEGVTSTVETGNGQYTLRAAKAEINGVRFTEVVDTDSGTTKLCAFNTDVDNYACVAYPNGYGQVCGEQIFIKPTETEELNVENWNTAPTSIPFYVQKMELSGDGSQSDNRIIIPFKNLSLDGTTLILTNTQLTCSKGTLQVSFPTANLGNLMMAELTSDSGIRATLREPIPYSQAGDFLTEYQIDISALGFSDSDIISGMMQFALSSEAVQKLKASIDGKQNKEFAEINRSMCKLCGIKQ